MWRCPGNSLLSAVGTAGLLLSSRALRSIYIVSDWEVLTQGLIISHWEHSFWTSSLHFFLLLSFYFISVNLGSFSLCYLSQEKCLSVDCDKMHDVVSSAGHDTTEVLNWNYVSRLRCFYLLHLGNSMK